jgi:hypothetical protein
VPSSKEHTPSVVLFCRALSAKPLFNEKLLHSAKAGQIAWVMICGSLANELTFSIMKTVTGQQPNSLTVHRRRACGSQQGTFTLSTVPLLEPIGGTLDTSSRVQWAALLAVRNKSQGE